MKIINKNIYCPLCHKGKDVLITSYSTRANHVYSLGERYAQTLGIRDLSININAICPNCNTKFSIDTKLQAGEMGLGFGLEVDDEEPILKQEEDEKSIEYYVEHNT